MTDAAGSETLSYDTMGRLWADQRTTGGITKSLSLLYNLDGSTYKLTYPSGNVLTYAVNSDAQPISLTDTTNSINYASAGAYAPQGDLSALSLGSSINLSNSYNDRLQPNELKAWSTAITAFDLTYIFSTGANNGNAAQITNNLNSNRTQQFSYDQVNRISTAGTISTCTSACWSQGFSYDEWGNLYSAVATGTGPALNISVGAANQITTAPFAYDPAGNETADTTSTYAWNAESEMKTADGINYTYDGNGNRVQKSNGKIYWYGAGTEVLDESDSSGNIMDEYLFFNGVRIAHKSVGSGSIYYYAQDFLRTSRVLMTSAGALCYDADFYPYGGEYIFTNTCSQNYKFTGKERDTESNLDNFGARYFSSILGRFMSPDPDNVSAGLHMDDPQSWNGYTYVRNNPGTLTDPTGENYIVCDADGNSCGNLTNDQWAQWLQQNQNVTKTPSGQLWITNDDGSRTLAGSSTYYNEQDVQAAQQITSLEGPLAFLGAIEAEFIIGPGMTMLEGTLPVTELVGGLRLGKAALDNAGPGTLQDILGKAVKTGSDLGYQKPGGAVQATKDFDAFPGTAVKTGNVTVKEVPGVGRVVLRIDPAALGTGGKPVLEIQPSGGGPKDIAVRYNP
jgi:RHS repeat-associated protein